VLLFLLEKFTKNWSLFKNLFFFFLSSLLLITPWFSLFVTELARDASGIERAVEPQHGLYIWLFVIEAYALKAMYFRKKVRKTKPL